MAAAKGKGKGKKGKGKGKDKGGKKGKGKDKGGKKGKASARAKSKKKDLEELQVYSEFSNKVQLKYVSGAYCIILYKCQLKGLFDLCNTKSCTSTSKSP